MKRKMKRSQGKTKEEINETKNKMKNYLFVKKKENKRKYFIK